MSDPAERDLLVEAEHLIAELQGRHGPVVAAQVTQLLDAIDAVHRAGLTHLMQAIRGMGGDAFVNKLVADPAIRMLLMSYDLVPVDRRLQADEALDSVRGHLHAHGVDVETLEVVGGVVYVRLHGVEAARLDPDAVVRDLEEALRVHFVGFQELVPHERQPRAMAVPLTLRHAQKPVFRDLPGVESLAHGTMRAVDVEGRPVLVVRVGQEWLALANRCGDSPLPLEFSRLDGTTLHCSWHGCQYDVRTGVRIDGPGERLSVFPVKVDHGMVRIAVNVEPA